MTFFGQAEHLWEHCVRDVQRNHSDSWLGSHESGGFSISILVTTLKVLPSNSLHQVLYPSVFESRRRRRRETPSERRARAAVDLSSRMLQTKERAS